MPFGKELVVCVHLVTQLGKITINIGNDQNIAFHSKSLDISRPTFPT